MLNIGWSDLLVLARRATYRDSVLQRCRSMGEEASLLLLLLVQLQRKLPVEVREYRLKTLARFMLTRTDDLSDRSCVRQAKE